MTIIFFTRYFYPHLGGVEKHTLEIGKKLLKRGHKLIVITSSESLPNSKRNKKNLIIDNVDGIKVYYLNTGKIDKLEKFRVWKEVNKIKNILEKADVIHCHDIFYWYFPFRFLYPGKKVYVTFHGYEGNNIPGKKAYFMHKTAEKFTDGNICIGDFFKKWYKTKPTIVSYGAVDFKNINNKKINGNKAMFIGRLEKETGIMDYLEALSILKNKKININLDVYGDGSLITNAKKYVKDNKLNVVFKGFVKNIEKYIKGYDIVFVSRYLGILEALAFKKYIFAVYNNDIKKDYLKMAPFSKFISISPNLNSLALEIEKYFKNKKEIEKKIELGFNWVKDKNWDYMTNLYLKLWEK